LYRWVLLFYFKHKKLNRFLPGLWGPLGDIHSHAVPGLQKKAAYIKDEITTPLALPLN
jgi:hypothetical protein